MTTCMIRMFIFCDILQCIFILVKHHVKRFIYSSFGDSTLSVGFWHFIFKRDDASHIISSYKYIMFFMLYSRYTTNRSSIPRNNTTENHSMAQRSMSSRMARDTNCFYLLYLLVLRFLVNATKLPSDHLFDYS